MPVITVEVDGSADIPAVVRVVRPITGGSLAEIRRAVAGGDPIFGRELFRNDFAEVADALRRLVRGLGAIGVPFVIREDGSVLTEEALAAILEGSERYRP